MNCRHLLLVPLAALAFGTSGVVHAHAEHGHAQHGGIVGEAGIFQGELVSEAKGLVLVLTDHGKAIPASGASGRLTVLVGTEKQEFKLVPAGSNRLVAEGAKPLAAGAKAVANVKLGDGRSGALRFEKK